MKQKDTLDPKERIGKKPAFRNCTRVNSALFHFVKVLLDSLIYSMHDAEVQ